MVVHIATTCDETTTYIQEDSRELIELAWTLVPTDSLETKSVESVLVKPTKTPITQFCSRLHGVTWGNIRNAETFKSAIDRFDRFMQEHVLLRGKDFSFVSLDTSQIGVHLSREARDKSVALPGYLQNPRVFDFQTEYNKWRQLHPELARYSYFSLTSIMETLEVQYDSLDRVAVLRSQGGGSGQRAPSEDPGTTGETKGKSTVELYTKLLTQLFKKLETLKGKEEVLTQPYDKGLEVEAFLSEKSKVLFLSNLRNDTTQSELESWFTQYGGRPLAFWALKGLEEQDKKGLVIGNDIVGKQRSIYGFAVFGTHEEAMESLRMNGRALNDRSIEVQASSGAVLDKASDALAPFSLLKNRPRPGDWSCPSCGFSNFQRRTACFRCSFPAASAVAIHESIFANTPSCGRRFAPSMQTPTADKSAYTSQLNQANTNAAGFNPLYSSNYPDQSFSSQSSYGSANHYSNNQGNCHSGSRSRGHSVPFRAGDWKCTNEACRYHNFAKNIVCLKCGVAKPNNIGNVHGAYVNLTSAAIAAATASGQSPSVANGIMPLQHASYGFPYANVSPLVQTSLRQGNNISSGNLASSATPFQLLNTSNHSISSAHASTPTHNLGQLLNDLPPQQFPENDLSSHYVSSLTDSPRVIPNPALSQDYQMYLRNNLSPSIRHAPLLGSHSALNTEI